MRTAEELRAKRKKQLKKDTASKMKSLVEEVCIILLGFFCNFKIFATPDFAT